MKSKLNKISIKVGINIKVLRIKRNLTQEELAEYANVSRAAISDIERGKSSPSVDTVGLIAEALKVDLYKLFILPQGKGILCRHHPASGCNPFWADDPGLLLRQAHNSRGLRLAL